MYWETPLAGVEHSCPVDTWQGGLHGDGVGQAGGEGLALVLVEQYVSDLDKKTNTNLDIVSILGPVHTDSNFTDSILTDSILLCYSHHIVPLLVSIIPLYCDSIVNTAGYVSNAWLPWLPHICPDRQSRAAHSLGLPGESLDPDIVESGRGQVCQDIIYSRVS